MVAKKLEKKLLELGAKVIMTRADYNATLSNIGRAKLANEANVDFVIRIHADGMNNKSAKGMSVLLPASKHIKDKNIISKSRELGTLILDECVRSTGSKNRGLVERPDMTGFNWSTVPAVLLEMGFMSNPEEDALLSTKEYQDKIVDGVVACILAYCSK